MSTIITDQNGRAFTLSPGAPVRFWWYGYGAAGYYWNIGFPLPPDILVSMGRLVLDNHGMQGADVWTGSIYTADLHAEGATVYYRMCVGELVRAGAS